MMSLTADRDLCTTNKHSTAHKSEHHLTHPKYRTDIDGLRAIAILSVVGFHAFPEWVKGGFVGVDIFFVISGYLISTIIFGSLARNSFSFVEFYIRRINRIFPALLLVLIACYIFGWFALVADEYKQLGKHIAGGAGFISNFLLWNESGYFDNAALTKPLLHLWSLGIEEQFYIVWPLMLWFAWTQRLNLLTITLVVLLISFALNIARVNGGHMDAAFYSPQTRFWELLVGSVLAYLTLHKQTNFSKLKPRLEAWFDKWLGPLVYAHPFEANGNTLRNIQSFIGGALIMIGIFYITKEKAFPGWWAVLPTAGTLFIISAGKQAWLNRVVLSSRVLVWFGLISFPLYLWHWPLLSFAHIMESKMPSREIRIATVLISIILAWLTYKLIEKPIKLGKQGNIKTITLWTMMVIVGCVGYTDFEQNGYSSRLTKLVSEVPDWWRGELIVATNPCTEVPGVVASWCRTTGSATVALLGDSHADLLMEPFIRNGNQKFSKLISMGAGNCQPSFDADVTLRCVKQISAALNAVVADDSIQYVIVTSWNEGVKGRLQESIDGYRKTFNILRQHKKKIVYFVDIPTLKENPRACINNKALALRAKLQPETYPKFCYGAGPSDLVPRDEYNKLVDAIKKGNPDILVYDPLPLFCRNNICKVKEGAVLNYADEGHLTAYGAQPIVEDLIKKIEQHFSE